MQFTTNIQKDSGKVLSILHTFSSDSFNTELHNDINYIYDNISRNHANYLRERLQEPTLWTTIRYNENGNPVATGRVLHRSVWSKAVRLLDRYALIEGNNGLLPKQYGFSWMLTEQEKVTQEWDTRFISMDNRHEKLVRRIIKIHGNGWYFQDKEYVTNKPDPGGLQCLGVNGKPFRRCDGISYTKMG